jgi:hypothetical protein
MNSVLRIVAQLAPLLASEFISIRGGTIDPVKGGASAVELTQR